MLFEGKDRRQSPFLQEREKLIRMREGSDPMFGRDLFPILESMYSARARAVNRNTVPDEFTFPGSRGEVRIEYISGVEKYGVRKAYNVYFVNSQAEEQGVAVIDYTSFIPMGTSDEVGIAHIDLESGRPKMYEPRILQEYEYPGFDESAAKDLSNELLIALNSLQKAPKGQGRGRR